MSNDIVFDLTVRTEFNTPQINIINSNRVNISDQQIPIINKAYRPILEFTDCPLNAGIISVSGGSMSGLYSYGSGLTGGFSGLFIPSGNYIGNATVAINSGKFINTNGNNNSASNILNLFVDTVDLSGIIRSPNTTDITLSTKDNSRLLSFVWNKTLESGIFDINKISVSGGYMWGFSTKDNKTYYAYLTGTGISSSGSVYIDKDKISMNQVGNIKSNTYSFMVDKIVPSSIITTQLSTVPNDPKYLMKAKEDANITFKINKSVTSFNLSKVKVDVYDRSTQIHSSGVLTSFSGGGNTYTATYPRKNDAQELITIYIDKDVFQDSAGNTNIKSNICSIELDSRPFILEDITVSDSDTIGNDKLTLKHNEAGTVYFTFNKPVVLKLSDITVFNIETKDSLKKIIGNNPPTDKDLTDPHGSLSWTVRIVAKAIDGTAKVELDHNLRNIYNELVTSDEVLYIPVSAVSPSLTITRANSDKIPKLLKGSTAKISFSLTEPSTNFALADITVISGTIGSFVTTTNKLYSLTLTPLDNNKGKIRIIVPSGVFTDASSNPNARAVLPILFNTMSPTVSISADNTILMSNETAVISFLFSEPCNFVKENISVIGGGSFPSALTTTDNITYYGTFVPNTTQISATLGVGINKFTSIDGNSNTVASNTLTLKTNQPP